NGITNRCKEFFQKSDRALDGLFKITKLFIPNIGKGGWESLQKEVGKEPEKIDNFLEVLDSILASPRYSRRLIALH
ncbi:hypothetical protein C9939_04385, partial [Pseudidiomarina aestuarii]